RKRGHAQATKQGASSLSDCTPIIFGAISTRTRAKASSLCANLSRKATARWPYFKISTAICGICYNSSYEGVEVMPKPFHPSIEQAPHGAAHCERSAWESYGAQYRN